MKVIKESLSIDEAILSKFENLPTKIRVITKDLFDKEELTKEIYKKYIAKIDDVLADIEGLIERK